MKYFENGSLRLPLKEAIATNQKHENQDLEKNPLNRELTKRGLSMPGLSLFKSMTLKTSSADNEISQNNNVTFSDFL